MSSMYMSTDEASNPSKLDRNHSKLVTYGRKKHKIEKKKTRFTGTSSKMKYLIRKPFGEGQDSFAVSGRELLRRTHIIDLRCPE